MTGITFINDDIRVLSLLSSQCSSLLACGHAFGFSLVVENLLLHAVAWLSVLGDLRSRDTGIQNVVGAFLEILKIELLLGQLLLVLQLIKLIVNVFII